MQSTTLKSRPAQAPAAPWRNVLPVHAAAKLLPRIPDPELRELGEDIKRRGLQTPISILIGDDGVEKLLDGISRLDAMEMVGLPVVTNGELNLEIVHSQNVAGNVDPVAYVLSANVHRRHLTGEQKRALIEEVLKVKPEQSDRTIARQVKADHKTVGKSRGKLEARGEIPHVKPARKPTKLSPTKQWMQDHPDDKPCPTGAPWAAAAWRRTRGIMPAKTAVAKAPAPKHEAPPKKTDLATTLSEHLNALLGMCERESSWPPLNSGRQKLRTKAVKKLRAALSELIKLASPAPRRGRPPKARAS